MKRKSIGRFLFGISHSQLNWLITKAKLRLKSICQVKLVHQKITKKRFESFILAFSYQVKRIIFKGPTPLSDHLSSKRIAWFTFKKELRRSNFLITIEEYVGAKGNTLVDHKKEKKYKKGIKDIET